MTCSDSLIHVMIMIGIIAVSKWCKERWYPYVEVTRTIWDAGNEKLQKMDRSLWQGPPSRRVC
jgi:hypothetical protein